MKTKVLIISFLIAALCGAFTLKAHSQDRTDSGKVLIADETYLKFYKGDAKITTTLESVFQDISLTWGKEFKKITITYKTVNHTRYTEYVIYLSNETGNNIKEWSKKNL